MLVLEHNTQNCIIIYQKKFKWHTPNITSEMYFRSMSISQAIKEILFTNNIYLQALQTGIANFTALAQRIKPEVDKLTDSDVSLNTIVVAIKRLSDILEKQSLLENESKENYDDFDVRMSLTGSIIDIEFENEIEEMHDILAGFELQSEMSRKINFFHSNKHFKLFTENVNEIREIFSRTSEKFDGKINEDLSMITITLPSKGNIDERKSYYILNSIIEILYNNQVRIQNAFFVPSEIVLVLKNDDAAKAYELLRQKINKQYKQY